MRRFLKLFMGFCCLPIVWNTPVYAQANSYSQQNLVTDPMGAGPVKDPNLINPWGICIIPGDPFWIADNSSPTGVTTLYDNSGAMQGSFTVAPPKGSSTPATPTGCVGNVAATGFNVTAPGGAPAPSLFIFDTEDGTISGWNGTGPASILVVDNSTTSTTPTTAVGAVYKGLALLTNQTGTFLLATNFHSGQVEVYDSNFHLANLTGTFTDPNPAPPVPAGSNSPGYASFGIHVITVNSQPMVVVAYALQDSPAKHDPLKIAGTGFVDLYDANGGFVRRITADTHLNAPWGAVVPPSGFGKFAGNLLIGNFGDGTINAFDLTSGNFIDQMKQANGTVIPNPGLWDMVFDPTGKTGKNANTMYFTAGGANEKLGLFGAITASPTAPPATPDFNISAAPSTLTITAGQPANFTVTLGSLNGFNSAISLTCSGQPLGSTCSLSPMSISPASGGTATSTVTISTSSNPYQLMASGKGNPAHTVFAMLLPISAVGFLGLVILGSGDKWRFHGRKWLQHLTGSLLLVIAMASLLAASGCYKKKTGTGTQRGTTTVMITGTSGSITHSASVTLSVQ
jgi:uncharacterized protein (TIGR03118 family)